MNCINCSKEATLTYKTGKVEFYVCEYCNEKFSLKRNGKASHREVENVQARQLQGFLDCQSGIEPTKRTIAKMESSREYSGKMNDPEWDRNAEGPGTIRARG